MRELVPLVADSQFGVFTAAQAIAGGASRAAVRHRLDIDEWIPVVGRGLVRRGHAVGHLQRAAAACLTWPTGVICLRSAAEFHQLPLTPPFLPEPEPPLVHLWLPTDVAPQPGLVAHRRAKGFLLGSSALAQRGSIHLTSKVETILDCLSLLDLKTARALSSWVLTRNLLPSDVLERALAERTGRHGQAQLRKVSELLLARAASGGELRLHRILTAAGIGGWQANASVRDRTGKMFNVDILFRQQGLIIELDGTRYHDGERRLADLDRHRRLREAGSLNRWPGHVPRCLMNP